MGTITFTSADPKTATIQLSELQSQTSYTLTLNPNPVATTRFMDLAGNPLPALAVGLRNLGPGKHEDRFFIAHDISYTGETSADESAVGSTGRRSA